jgi:hypothetical protein
LQQSLSAGPTEQHIGTCLQRRQAIRAGGRKEKVGGGYADLRQRTGFPAEHRIAAKTGKILFSRIFTRYTIPHSGPDPAFFLSGSVPMKLSSKSPFTLIVAATLVACAMGFLAPLSGQEAKAKAKTKGRLPAYFAQVVDAKQREQIYSIQAKYKEQIEKLEAELKAANDKLKEEVEAVLSKEQKEKLDKLRAEAKPRGKAGKATSSKEEANDASKTQ